MVPPLRGANRPGSQTITLKTRMPMQGKLHEMDATSLLQLIELGQRSGELFLETEQKNRFWIVSFDQGRCIYAAETEGGFQRLKDYLQRFNLGNLVEGQHASMSPSADQTAPEYAFLLQLVDQGHLSQAQAKQIIQAMVEEVFFDLIGLNQGSFIFDDKAPPTNVLLPMEVGSTLKRLSARMTEWQKLKPRVFSPEQRPFISSQDLLQQKLPQTAYEQLVRWVNGTHSLRSIARFLCRDVVTVTKAIMPYVEQGILGIHDLEVSPLRAPSPSKSTRVVVCIDDSIVIQKSVENFLGGRGYQVHTIANPVKAIADLYKLMPDLILMDIAMPKMDGYELCAMIRKSGAFHKTPVVMLTGKDGFIDRVRARMAGATEYLTKPFGEQDLLTIVDKYVGSAEGNAVSSPSSSVSSI
jgi:twitching motility two-component system response regulator PilG